MSDEYKFGANILEILTTGMYRDSKVIFREYIQNSCDSIDSAVKNGLLKKEEGKIEIWLDTENRKIAIEDNAIGIKSDDFKRVLGNIAEANKVFGESKGFKGIGRLFGLAYCEKLVFTSGYSGENIISIMTCNAKKMREMLNDNIHGKKHSAAEVLNTINSFSCGEKTQKDGHFFRVELIGINAENTDLLDFQKIKDYLSFCAPVPYQNTLLYRNKIYGHAKELGVCIDEYIIKLDGEQIFKKYVTDIKDKSGKKDDDIFDVEFHDFHNKQGELIAWMWFGLSQFKNALPQSTNPMRGLRLRKENIQIGNEDTLQPFFKEERGNSYFVGEIFAVYSELIPNSQRDYFNENPVRVEFESLLKSYFAELSRMYRLGSEINSANKKQNEYEKLQKECEIKTNSGFFVDKEQKTALEEDIQTKKLAADEAWQKIENKKKSAPTTVPLTKIIHRIESVKISSADKTQSVVEPEPAKKPPVDWITQQLSRYNNAERKLVRKILSVIVSNTEKEIADMLTQKIIESLKQ
jgi:molecular chaperone HtpG